MPGIKIAQSCEIITFCGSVCKYFYYKFTKGQLDMLKKVGFGFGNTNKFGVY